MNIDRFHYSIAYVSTKNLLQILTISLGFILLTACASSGPQYTAPPDLDQNPYAKLYEGKSETVFSTLFPPATAIEAIKLGDDAALQGEYDEALFRYVQALYLDDSIPEIFYKIGVIHSARSSPELAELAYSQALLRRTDYPEATKELGLTQLKLQKYAAAEETLLKAKTMLPQDWRILNTLGIIEDINKNHAAAQDLYKQAITINPDLAELKINLGYSMFLAGEYEQAITIINTLLAKDSRQNRAWMNLGLAYVKTARYNEAVKAFNQVLSIEDAYNNVGYLCFLQARRNPQSEEVAVLINTARSYFNLAIKQSLKYHVMAEKNLAELEEWVLATQRS